MHSCVATRRQRCRPRRATVEGATAGPSNERCNATMQQQQAGMMMGCQDVHHPAPPTHIRGLALCTSGSITWHRAVHSCCVRLAPPEAHTPAITLLLPVPSCQSRGSRSNPPSLGTLLILQQPQQRTNCPAAQQGASLAPPAFTFLLQYSCSTALLPSKHHKPLAIAGPTCVLSLLQYSCSSAPLQTITNPLQASPPPAPPHLCLELLPPPDLV